MIHVKNIGRGPQSVEGLGVLEAGADGEAQDTDHTRALIDAGHLLALDDEPPAVAEPDLVEPVLEPVEKTATTTRSRAAKGD